MTTLYCLLKKTSFTVFAYTGGSGREWPTDILSFWRLCRAGNPISRRVPVQIFYADYLLSSGFLDNYSIDVARSRIKEVVS
jgi:hypothetical protein